MLKKYRKQFFVIFVVLLLVLVGICFYFFKLKRDIGKQEQQLKVSFSQSDVVSIKNILPVADDLGVQFDGTGTEEGVQGYVEFSIQNLSSSIQNYEIYLTKQTGDSKEIKDNYIKLFLTDFSDQALLNDGDSHIPSYNELSYLRDKPNSKLLYSGELDGSKEKKFRLRVWLSDSYVLLNRLETFSFDIDVR